MADKLPNGRDDKGFGGLADLVSDISKDLESAAQILSIPPINKQEFETTKTDSSQQQSPQTESPLIHSTSAPIHSSGGSGVKWLFGGAIGLFILIAIGNSGKKESQPYTPPTSYESAPAPVPVPVSISPDPIASPSVEKTANSPEEYKPPVGNGLVLNHEQIRYCLSQKIRLDAIEKVVKPSNKSEVNSFNALISDYNNRCSNFKYRGGLLERTRAEVEAEQTTIEAAAQHSWMRESLGLNSPPKNTAKSIQKELDSRNSQYSVQTQEEASPSTNHAVVGAPSQEAKGTSRGTQVMIPTNAVGNDYSQQGWLCKSGFRQNGSECRQVMIPTNAVGNDYAPQGWLCKSGFRQNGSECRQVMIPTNAVGNDYAPQGWLCKSGFRQNGSECRQVMIPTNAVGNDYAPQGWLCKSGFRQNGSECRQVMIPTNAVGNDYAPQGWLCKSGFRQNGSECRQVMIPTNAVGNDYAPQGWLCKSGFRQNGSECRQVMIPTNAVGNDYAPQGWLCKSGFRQNGSECWPVVSSN